jgi:hypothetical protein
MLRAEIKRLGPDNKWKPIPVDEIVDNSLVDWIEQAEGVIIVAIFEDEKAVAFISNRQKYVDMYMSKGFACLASDLKHILLPTLQPIQLVADIFPDSTLKELRTVQ